MKKKDLKKELKRLELELKLKEENTALKNRGLVKIGINKGVELLKWAMVLFL